MFSDILFRLRSLLRRSTVENELDDELQFHIEQQVDKHVRAGLPVKKLLDRPGSNLGV